MTLSLATFLLFVALTPGAMFVFGIRKFPNADPGDIFDSHVQEVVTLVLVSFSIILITILLFLIICPSYIDSWIQLWDEWGKPDTVPLARDIREMLVGAGMLLAFVYIAAFVTGRVYPWLYFKQTNQEEQDDQIHTVDGLRNYLFNIRDNEYVFAWVVTNTFINGKHLMYFGLLKSAKIRKNDVLQVVIKYPSKTYMDFESGLSTYHTNIKPSLPRPVAEPATKSGILVIHKENMANIYVEKFREAEETKNE
jgi:hypothetical protein